jgi:AcrR family transcriptional regulator
MATRRHPKGQGHLLRAEIITATAELMRRSARVDDISIRVVARLVGRTTPQIYEHFANRDDLLRHAALAEMEAMAERVASAVGNHPDVRRRLRGRAHAYVEFATTNPLAYRVLFMGDSETVVTMTDLFAISGMAAVVADLKAARKEGRLAPGGLQTIGLSMWAAIHGVASLYVAHPNAKWPQNMLDQLLDQLATGVVPRE